MNGSKSVGSRIEKKLAAVKSDPISNKASFIEKNDM
jgi:hypothetical protein